MGCLFLFLILTSFVYRNLSHGLTGWAGPLGCFREFFVFLHKVNSVAYYAFARRFVSYSPRRYPIYRVERAGFGRHLSTPPHHTQK